MPVIINELIIKATVEANAGPPARGAPASTGGQSSAADRDALVRAIVEEVMRILERQKER